MSNLLFTCPAKHSEEITGGWQIESIDALEAGQVLYYPALNFKLLEAELPLLSDSVLDGKHKNVSYDFRKNKLASYQDKLKNSPEEQHLQQMMKRFALFAQQLVHQALPHYQSALIWGRTSFRPAEIKGRASSKRKDDTRLHVDAFPATPVRGYRILRVFSNINPNQQPRVWHLGEPLPDLIAKFADKIPDYSLLQARILYWIKATKNLRSAYDHYMLNLHDRMKMDEAYQRTVAKERVDFPAQTSWIVFTDQVSHAALGGQHLLEQTFYLPVEAMQSPQLSPLKQWEKVKGEALVV